MTVGINAKTKTAMKLFLPWQDEDEEKWLEIMSAGGWQLVSAVPFFYSFKKVSPKQTSIRLDYKSSWDKDYQEYLVTFYDAGWTLLTTLGNWHYFNINPKNDVVPEIYNSNRTKAQKYRRVLLGLSPLMLLMVGPLVHAFDFGSHTAISGLDIALRALYLFAAAIFIYSFLRVCVKLILLKTNYRE
ncbi:MAG: DUF2812 domain-containing protein [Anaerolineae bacterium]|nr:DUF2812 domain-containing protein [Anaerolineae bacterium]